MRSEDWLHSQRRNWLFVMCLLVVISAGCRLSPHLVFQKSASSGSDFAHVFAGPIVVVGVIESDTLVRGPTHSDGALVQLRKLKIPGENVLRGNAIGETVIVYYFTWAGAFDGPKPLDIWSMAGIGLLHTVGFCGCAKIRACFVLRAMGGTTHHVGE
jgi:hypothetical protein